LKQRKRVSFRAGAPPPNPRDLSHESQGSRGRADLSDGPPLIPGPGRGARVGSHRCPILRTRSIEYSTKKNRQHLQKKEIIRSQTRRVPLGLSGHLPLCLCARKERLFKFRGAVAAPLGKISDVANSMLARWARHPRQKVRVTRGTTAGPTTRPSTRPQLQSTLRPETLPPSPYFALVKNVRSRYGYGAV